MTLAFPDHTAAAPIASIVAAVAFSIVGVFLVDPAVLAFTAIQGSTMIVLCCVTILNHILADRINVCESASQHPLIVFVMIAALALLGAMYQATPRKSAAADSPSPKDAG